MQDDSKLQNELTIMREQFGKNVQQLAEKDHRIKMLVSRTCLLYYFSRVSMLFEDTVFYLGHLYTTCSGHASKPYIFSFSFQT